jgi:hypothetical protein
VLALAGSPWHLTPPSHETCREGTCTPSSTSLVPSISKSLAIDDQPAATKEARSTDRLQDGCTTSCGWRQVGNWLLHLPWKVKGDLLFSTRCLRQALTWSWRPGRMTAASRAWQTNQVR